MSRMEFRIVESTLLKACQFNGNPLPIPPAMLEGILASSFKVDPKKEMVFLCRVTFDDKDEVTNISEPIPCMGDDVYQLGKEIYDMVEAFKKPVIKIERETDEK